MVEVIGVHGIAQAGKTAGLLGEQWTTALREGFRRSGTRTPAPELVVPHLSPLLNPKHAALGPGADLCDMESMTEGEIAFIESGLADVLADLDLEQIDRLAAQGLTLAGFPAFPTRRGMRLIAAVDGRWRGGGELVLSALREVYAYLHILEVGSRVRNRVVSASGADTRLLLAHSLGSVVAFDLLNRGELPQVTSLVTFGTPLAWPTIRRSLTEQSPEAATRVTKGVPWVAWANVHDLRDAVTAGMNLRPIWSQVIDRPVENPRLDAHGADGYLRQSSLADAVITGLRP